MGVSRSGYGGYINALMHFEDLLKQVSYTSTRYPEDWSDLKVKVRAVINYRQRD